MKASAKACAFIDASLKKVAEADIDIDWDAVQKKTQQGCPMSHMMQ